MTDPDWSKCPEATHFDPVDQNFLCEVGEALLLFNNKRGWIVPTYTVYGLSIEECQRPLLKRPAWDGEGLPPVGTACEVENEFAPGWDLVDEVLAHTDINGSRVAVFKRAGRVFFTASGKFRPPRTPEQIAADERVDGIEEMLEAYAYTVNSCTHRLAHSQAARLYDIGYRKQVAP